MADGTKAGYLFRMALSAFCSSCQRTVYVEVEDTLVCPVCSSPLVEAITPADDEARTEEPVEDNPRAS